VSDYLVYNEQQYKQWVQKRLLTELIKKYERSKSFTSGEPSKQKPQMPIKNSPFHEDYEDEMDFRKREWIHSVIAQLSTEGIITYTWEKFREGRQIAKVYLELERLEAAYDLAMLTPKDRKMDELRDTLLPLRSHPWHWVSEWATAIMAALEERKSAGLDLDDLTGYEQLVKVLCYLPHQEDDIPKRVLSQRLFHDSKMFERNVERRLAPLIKFWSDMEFESDTDALGSVGISDHPRSVLISGSVELAMDENKVVSLEVFRGGVGLSWDTVRFLEIQLIPAERLILIENLTSWHQWIAQRSEASEIVIYTGGFPNRSVQLLFTKIAEYMRNNAGQELPVYHWGDMDVGGIQILEYIRRTYFPNLHPLGMDVDDYLKYAASGMDINAAYKQKIRGLLEDESLVQWHELLRLMLEHKKRVEQESVVDLPRV
jgi:hypothetical protein